MPVRGRQKPRVRVNDTPTIPGETPENYGCEAPWRRNPDDPGRAMHPLQCTQEFASPEDQGHCYRPVALRPCRPDNKQDPLSHAGARLRKPMPIVQAERLTQIGVTLLRAAGASEEEAQAVAVGCVNANLAGHDSHGIIAIPTYIDRIKAGHIVPGAPWTIVQESPTTTVIDGHWGFGFHVNAKAMALTIEKAKTANVAACTVFRQSHVGRLAAYPMMAMREGMIGLATADSGRSPKHVAPFGGREARLGTNPISIAVPSGLEAPFYLDMATSAVAARQIALAVARGEQIPQGGIIDAEGRHTTDPTQDRKGGALLPLGGREG